MVGIPGSYVDVPDYNLQNQEKQEGQSLPETQYIVKWLTSIETEVGF
jgi:hypothetical protein